MRKAIYLMLVLGAALAIIMVGCGRKGPVPITAHEDECDYCHMRINDLRFAAELIEKGGLVRKFDAIECLVAYIQEKKPKEYKAYVMDYLGSGFIEAEKAYYLISHNLPSPMGLDISAFRTKEDRDRFLKEKGGKPYTWEELFTINVPEEFKKIREKKMHMMHVEEKGTETAKEEEKKQE